VLADGELVATRSHSPIARLLGTGWPDETKVVEALRQRLQVRDRQPTPG
jgi:hypothetical protein